MAKRRNLKKEKALRNLAYARKFRKRNTRFKRQFAGSAFGEAEGEEVESTEETDAGAV
ncbi:MAG: hypothetical protein ACK4QL_06200 [Pseudanabaenaceae cyanobacterium]